MSKGFYRRALIAMFVAATCSASATAPRLCDGVATTCVAAERLSADGQEGKGKHPERLRNEGTRLRLDGKETHG